MMNRQNKHALRMVMQAEARKAAAMSAIVDRNVNMIRALCIKLKNPLEARQATEMISSKPILDECTRVIKAIVLSFLPIAAASSRVMTTAISTGRAL